jgi:hypothetical protein
MNKLILILVVLSMLLIPVSAIAKTIPVYDENGRMLVLKPAAQETDGCTMVPIRAIAEYFNAIVKWEASAIFIIKGETQVILRIGNKTAEKQVNGKKTEFRLDRAPYLENDRVMVPLRFVSEGLGERVAYYGSNNNDAIILGNNQYHGSIEYERILGNNQDEEKLIDITKRYQESNVYDYRAVWSVSDHFLFYPLNQITISYCHNYNYDRETAEKMRRDYSYYLSNELQQGQDWMEFLSMALTLRSDLEGYIIDVSSTETTIRGTFCVGLFSILYDIPLVFEAELTKQDAAWLVAAPQSTLDGWINPDQFGAWKVTNISNPRSYLNIQSLSEAEPKIYEQLILMRQYHHKILQ